MLNGNHVTLQNGLCVTVDWLSWTLEEPCTVLVALEMMGYSEGDFQRLPIGCNGYRSQFRHTLYPISIQFDGNANMGIHIDVPGSAVGDLLSHFQSSRLVNTPFNTSAYETDSLDSTVFKDLLTCIKKLGHVTRIDLAIDDIGGNYYSLSDLHHIFESGSYISKFRKWKELKNNQSGVGVLGHTIYLGSRTSDIMLRIYDKQLEQNEKLLASGSMPIEHLWVRWELELKRERSQQAVDLILSGHPISFVAIGILGNYLRLIRLDNERKNRCTVSEKWLCFLNDILGAKLYRPQLEKTLEDTKNWLLRQVAPSLATVVMADSSLEFIDKLVEIGGVRLKKHQLDIISREGVVAV